MIIVVLIGLCGLGLAGLHSWFYPIAAPMPAIVSEPMPEILARLDHIIQTNAPHVSALLQPGLSAIEISRLEAKYQIQIPDEIRLIYQWHNGSCMTTNYPSKEFMPGARFLPLDEELEERRTNLTAKGSWMQRLAYRYLAGYRDPWICLFSDGSGVGYWFDPNRKPSEGSVFFNFNETGSYVFFPSAKNLMAGVAKCYEQGAFHVKAGSSPPQLDEDYSQSEKIWAEFGAARE